MPGRIVTALGALALCLGLAAPAVAADVALRYAILSSQTTGAHMSGSLSVEVQNLTGATLDNVDVRFALPGGDALAKGLIQVGRIPAGEARRATSGFVLDVSRDAPLLWRVDYDAGGAHQQVVVPGLQEVR